MIKHRFSPRKFLGAAFLLAFSGSAFATVLFTENFSGATAGQAWNGYNGWEEIVSEGGTPWLTIRSEPKVASGMAGHFRYSSSTPGSNGTGAIQRLFDEPFELSAGAYQLSFAVYGRVHRAFQVTLMDSRQNRIGLQLGYENLNDYNISGVYMDGTTGERTLFTQGRYWSPRPGGEQPPDGWVYSNYYTVHVEINGSTSTLMIGGAALEAGKGRVVYNTDDATAPSYTILFDLPEDFSDIAGLMLVKQYANENSWGVGELQLQVAPIPEPSVAVLAIAGVAGGLLLLRRRSLR